MTISVSANNGKAPADALSAMPGVNGDGSPHTAPHCTVLSYARLRDAMVSAGQGDLSPTANGWSCYRDRAAQQHMRDIGLTTIPVGQSIHGEWTYGSAVDFQGLGGFGAPRHNWLKANGGAYGWYQPGWAQANGSTPESWHWEYDQRGDSHLGEDDVTPDEVYTASANAMKDVLRAPEFMGYLQTVPWTNPMTAQVGGEGGWVAGPTPVQGFVADIYSTVVTTQAKVDALASVPPPTRATSHLLRLLVAVGALVLLVLGGGITWDSLHDSPVDDVPALLGTVEAVVGVVLLAWARLGLGSSGTPPDEP